MQPLRIHHSPEKKKINKKTEKLKIDKYLNFSFEFQHVLGRR